MVSIFIIIELWLGGNVISWQPTPKLRRYLVIEDESDIVKLLKLHLTQPDVEIEHASNGHEGLQKAQSQQWDLILLDLQLPGMDGLDICRQLRSKSLYVPILMITSRSSELDRVLGLELGADDYITKPFNLVELQARIKAVLRRTENRSETSEVDENTHIFIDHLKLNRDRREVQVEDVLIDLTAKEFELLWFFACHQGKVFTRGELLDAVWGYGHDGYEHTVNSHINRLRSKIEEDPTKPRYIQTVWGVGYRFK